MNRSNPSQRNSAANASRPPVERAKRGRKPKPIVAHPTPLTTEWIDPPTLGAALDLHTRRHGDTLAHLHKAIIRPGERFDRKILYNWASESKVPGTTFSMTVLERIEDRYRLPDWQVSPKAVQQLRGRNRTGRL